MDDISCSTGDTGQVRERYNKEKAWELWSVGNAAVSKLQNCLSMLPKVNEDGTSECPFAETLYAEKEEAEQTLRSTVNLVRSYVPVIEEALVAAQSDLGQIQDKIGGLSGEEVKEELKDAEREARRLVNEILKDQRWFSDLLSSIQHALGEARAKRFPARAPKKSSVSAPPLAMRQALPPPPLPPPPAAPLAAHRTPLLPAPSMALQMPPVPQLSSLGLFTAPSALGLLSGPPTGPFPAWSR